MLLAPKEAYSLFPSHQIHFPKIFFARRLACNAMLVGSHPLDASECFDSPYMHALHSKGQLNTQLGQPDWLGKLRPSVALEFGA